MTFKWVSQKERLLKSMKISPKKKMEWLHEMYEFTIKYSSKRANLIRKKLRTNHK